MTKNTPFVFSSQRNTSSSMKLSTNIIHHSHTQTSIQNGYFDTGTDVYLTDFRVQHRMSLTEQLYVYDSTTNVITLLYSDFLSQEGVKIQL